MVDRDLLLRKLADLDQYLNQVSEYRDITVDQYRGDWKTQRIVERTLQMTIELCVDIANHIIADRGLRVPATYSEAFDVLGEAGLLDAARRDVMIRMSKFRNVIVHDYARVDPTIVVQILREHLEDFTRFKAAALKWI
ncbi:MAG TPA: DUF86 domain-containing protein [Patescibacteria group bacterium]|nr:DUF86 domain-containing protein [Patescibacteria group bacterium]